jgi:hypothetical protein
VICRKADEGINIDLLWELGYLGRLPARATASEGLPTKWTPAFCSSACSCPPSAHSPVTIGTTTSATTLSCSATSCAAQTHPLNSL